MKPLPLTPNRPCQTLGLIQVSALLPFRNQTVNFRSRPLNKYKKTRVMNLIGGWCLALLGIVLFFNKVGSQSNGIFATILFLYGIVVGTALGTARALTEGSPVILCRSMMWLNWVLVGVYALGVIATVLGTFAAPDVMKRMLVALIPGVLVFVVPELINIRALSSIQSATANEAKSDRREGRLP